MIRVNSGRSSTFRGVTRRAAWIGRSTRTKEGAMQRPLLLFFSFSVFVATASLGCSKGSSSTTTLTAAPSGEVAEGKPAPQLRAKAHDGTEIDLAALKGKPVVLYFYPKDETP